MTKIYKIINKDEWQQARSLGRYDGSADDRRDGFIHFSTAQQLHATAAKHFAGRNGLVLLQLDAYRLGNALKWEPARDGALFPHLYGPMPANSVCAAWPLPLDQTGMHCFPEELQ